MPILLLAAVAIGVLVSVQAGVNGRLGAGAGHPVLAAAISFVIGTLGLLVVLAAIRPALPSADALGRLPWWAWTGGLLGATFIAGAVVLAPRLGAALLTAGIMAGQLTAALVLDHYGLVGFARQPVTLSRVMGAVLLFVGVLLIRRR
jgi:transporter family-2 protein